MMPQVAPMHHCLGPSQAKSSDQLRRSQRRHQKHPREKRDGEGDVGPLAARLWAHTENIRPNDADGEEKQKPKAVRLRHGRLIETSPILASDVSIQSVAAYSANDRR